MRLLTGPRRNIWGSLTLPLMSKPEQGETQAEVMGCEVTDEPVVVRKSRPMKPGNSVEGKTGMTGGLVRRR